MGEMMEEAIDSLDDDEIEEEAEEEVSKVLFELTDGESQFHMSHTSIIFRPP
jgi:charged multivesicular body protein 3